MTDQMLDLTEQPPAPPPGPPPRPPGSRRAWRILWWAGVAVVGIVLVAVPTHLHPLDGWIHRLLGHSPAGHEQPGQAAAPAKAPGERKVLFYRNPMNPAVTSPVPAKDEMGMDYVPVYAEETKKGERKVLFYRNPMNPAVTSPVPAKDEMGMDYVPVYADEAKETGGAAVVKIDPAVVQNMNVKTAPVLKEDLARSIRTVGTLDYDQEKMVSVTTKYSGYVEKAFANYLGQPVRKGQPLFEIYSPELVQTESELLSALDYVRRMGNAPQDAQERAQSLVKAARARLSYWDVAPAQVARLEKAGEVFRTLTLVAPSSGVVMKRMEGIEGMAVKPGMELLHIADLSTLWLRVEVYENQFPWLDVGSRATVTLTYFPGETFQGRVRYIEPQIAEKTRTVSLTLEVKNADGRLRSGMYATVEFQPVVAKGALTVPSQAVIRTGERNILVMALGGGRFEARAVELGPEGNGRVQVKKGVHDGESVVTSAQFLIDSESNLQAAIQMLTGPSKAKP